MENNNSENNNLENNNIENNDIDNNIESVFLKIDKYIKPPPAFVTPFSRTTATSSLKRFN